MNRKTHRKKGASMIGKWDAQATWNPLVGEFLSLWGLLDPDSLHQFTKLHGMTVFLLFFLLRTFASRPSCQKNNLQRLLSELRRQGVQEADSADRLTDGEEEETSPTL